MSRNGRDHGRPPAEPESLSQLREDCAEMSPRWTERAAEERGEGATPGSGTERPRGVHVPVRSARLLDGMSDYGD